MSSNKNTLLVLILCIVVAIANAIFVAIILSPTLKLKGQSEVVLGLNSTYKDAGVEANFNGENINKDVKITGKVDTSKTGTYEITYHLKKGIYEKELSRKIIVKDLEAPVIELKGEKEVHLAACKAYEEEGFTAMDDLDGDVTSSVKTEINPDKITYTVTDKAKNKTVVERKIFYDIKTKPTIYLVDGTTLSIVVNGSYKEPGYSAKDGCGNDLTDKVNVDGTVDTSKIGNNRITYTVTDSDGNSITVIRNVNIIEKLTNGIVYLTFDDGPGQYTEQILNILAQNNIKATFFVTNQFPKYQGMIKKEYEQGHTVALHTYSHSWSIYDSVDAYLDDFNKMDNIIYEQTGEHTKYFRFPGGSSNTVSRKHKVGIMTELAKVMTDKGYTYFDWHVDCGDTHKNNTVNYIVNNIKTYVKGNQSYIILLHDIKKNTLGALPSIISYLKNRGYEFKALNDSTPVKQFRINN